MRWLSSAGALLLAAISFITVGQSSDAAALYKRGLHHLHDDVRGQREPTLGVAEIKQAAEKGYAPAQYTLCSLYLEGTVVVANAQIARDWCVRAAEGGSAYAAYVLGRLSDPGPGRNNDPEEAARWYRTAAELGLADAQATLGLAYELGAGVERNPEEALTWLTRAANQGNQTAQLHLSAFY